MNVDDTRSAKSEKSDKPRVIVEKIIERSPSDMEKQKDWAPLMGDFDKRMDKLERKLNDQDATNNRVDGKMNDHDEAIRKILSDIKLLKMSRPKSQNKDDAGDPAMNGD